MRFLSDILAKAGLIVDGAAVFNSSATGQTPASNDNSTKFATTAWVRSFVQPYTLPIASSTVLGGIKVGTGLAIDAITGVLSVSGGSITLKSTQTFTATAGQSIFTIANGYTAGLIDVFLNGVYLSPGQTTATNGSTVTLTDPALAGDIIDVIITSPIGQGSIATTDSLPEGTVNLYYTPARVRTAISLTTTGVSGAATYDNVTGLFNIPNYQGLVPSGGNSGQLLAKIDGSDYSVQWIDEAPAASYTSQIKHQVKTSQAINKGQAVYVSSSNGTNMVVSKASNGAEATSSKTMGLLEVNASANGFVNVIAEGLLAGLNTASANAGDPVWLGTDGNLIYGLVNKPVAPAHLVFIGIVTRSNANNGEIFVKVQNGFELDELHDLSVKNASDGDMIKYVASTGLWTKIAASTTNIVEGTNLYYTDARVSAYLTANSYATQGYVNTAISNLVASAPTTLDTLNELATALGNDPNFATTIATSIGTKVPQARTITINGTAYDLSADRAWSIAAGVTSFNTRTGAITLTSGDVTGALGYTPVTNARTLTINGIGYDLSADRSWTITTSDATKLPLNGGTLTGALTIGPFDGQALKLQAATSTGSSYLRFYNSAAASRGYLGLFWNGTSDYMVLDAGALEINFGSSNKFTFTGGGTASFNGTVAINGSNALYLNNTDNTTTSAILNGGTSGVGIMQFYQGGSERMRLSNGNLGIGTITPNGKLDIVVSSGDNNQVRLSGPSAVYKDLQWKNSDDGKMWIWSKRVASDGDGFAAWYYNGTTYNSVPSLMLTTSGLVGINTTTPFNFGSGSGMLDVRSQNAGSVSGVFVSNSDATARVTIYINPGATATIGTSTNHAVQYVTNDIERMRLLTDGPLSFSTIATVPTYNNSIYSTSANGYMYIQGGTTGLALTGSGNRNNGIYVISTLNAIAFHTNNQGERVRITDAGFLGVNTTNPLAPLHVNGDTRTTGLRLNQGTNNQGHRIYSRTMDVSAYSTQTNMRFTVAGGNNVQFQYEVTFHATRLSGTLAEIWYLRYTGGVVYDTAGNASERWWDLREQAGNGIAGVGRNNNTGNLEIHNSAFDTSCRLTVCVKITCNNWDAVTVSFS